MEEGSENLSLISAFLFFFVFRLTTRYICVHGAVQM